MSKKEIKDLQDFSEGQTVNIDGIKDMQGVVILRIAQGGTTISSRVSGELIISNKSPAILSEHQRGITIETDPHTRKRTIKISKVNIETLENSEQTDNGEPRERVSRGTYSAKMDNLDFPKGAFTAQQLADLNDIPYPYAVKYCKEYLEEAGHAERKEGQRGKSAQLYKIG